MDAIRRRTHQILEGTREGDLVNRVFEIFMIVLIAGNVLAVILETVHSLGAAYGGFYQEMGLHVGDPHPATAGVVQKLHRLADQRMQDAPKELRVSGDELRGCRVAELVRDARFASLQEQPVDLEREVRVGDHGNEVGGAQKARVGRGLVVAFQGRREAGILHACGQRFPLEDGVLAEVVVHEDRGPLRAVGPQRAIRRPAR